MIYGSLVIQLWNLEKWIIHGEMSHLLEVAVHFTLKQLRYFDAALRTGSIAKAAAEMNISQSSITSALDVLEQTVGQELFRRVPAKGLQPSETGVAVGERISSFLEQARLFEADLLSISGKPAGRLHIGCYMPSAPFIVPLAMKMLAEHHPSIRVELIEADLTEMAAMLLEDKIDLALTYQRMLPGTLPFLPIFQAPPFALLPKDSPLSQQATVSIKDLSAMPIILLDLPEASDYFLDMFRDRGLDVHVVHSTKSAAVLRGLVGQGFGHAILNICSPSDRDGSGGYVVRPIVDDVMSPVFGVSYKVSARRSTLIQAVLDAFQRMADQGTFNDLLLKPTDL